ncbi:MAG: hypothetical protein HY329_24180 [Chloroflexi bacterium]|nr:hypothetical protein [Chloroflexota bacterium]
MAVLDLANVIGDRVRTTAQAETIYGETRVVGDHAIIPVAKLRYGFGFGGGRGSEPASDDDGDGGSSEGAGGGVGVSLSPVGYIVIDDDGPRFVRIGGKLQLVTAFLVGLAVGFLLVGRRRARLT